MRVNTMQLKNFRLFEEKTFSFSEQFTVLIGNNGRGKSTTLDALAIGIGSLFLGFDEVRPRYIKSDEVRRNPYPKLAGKTAEPQYPASICCEGIVNEQAITWERSLYSKQGHTTHGQATEISAISRQFQSDVRAGRDCLLPLVAYYSTGRLWLFKKEKGAAPPGSRMEGYADCLEIASNLKQFLQWYRRVTYASIQGTGPRVGLKATEDAVINCVPGCTKMYYDIGLEEPMLFFEAKASATDDTAAEIAAAEGADPDMSLYVGEEGKYPFRLLSDGVRNMVGLVQDIAYRTVVLNPHLENAPQETPGVVLIDELDLHMHPKWQQRIVDDLRRTFPKLQFIATTHSPFIIQSMRRDEVLDLNEKHGDHYLRSIEDIVEDVMGIPVPVAQRGRRFKDMWNTAQQYYGLLEEAERADPQQLEAIEAELDRLSALFSDDVAYQAFLDAERKTRLWEGDHASG